MYSLSQENHFIVSNKKTIKTVNYMVESQNEQLKLNQGGQNQ